jgi:hypothetical protein
MASELVSTCEELDLALFELPLSTLSGTGKRPFLLSTSDWITEERIHGELSTAAYICALHGSEAIIHQYGDGTVYLQAPLYSAIGPIVSCSSTEIVADFAENELLFANAAQFPQLANFVPTGGERHLGGISGSGLWVRQGESMFLAGVVQGRNPGANDQHLVRPASIWAVRQWLAGVVRE